ncbi:hypothetical protein W97_05798 [Coniosporium apollinis CBS 100218]|uniref:DNA repair protein RAD14 n=1 Tax=Coniosporium apollinis (strain CBS 100218) TaxID=1168221 RepID=R7YXH3_CONA1|nr:uncharacterized protein W97_05798 [Coniosporium apollinis CBS 100218]EON66553.1 hypothetical protein W97_05798 [Coniosporium apollinis CBS 100218]
MAERPSTPPRPSGAGNLPAPPLTPEQVRQLEINRLKAKALRNEHDSTHRASGTTTSTTPSGFNVSQKRPHSSLSSSNTPSSHRDARNNASTSRAGSALPGAGLTQPKDNGIQPAKKFEKNSYIEYDFSTMTDTKGGFLSSIDDPHNRALHAPSAEEQQKPAHMTLAEWDRHQLLKKLRQQKAGPFEPGISVLAQKEAGKKCRECGSLEIDWKWEECFGTCVCNACKEKFPEKYSLLTKTEARDDYLLTDPELKDTEILPHLLKPNPHKSTFASMHLYLRYQVEEYAFSPQKWGSSEALDAEFERRVAEKNRKKEKKFSTKLAELKKRTRVEAYKRSLNSGGGDAGEVRFGDRIKRAGDKHEHEWGRAVLDPETGMTRKRCEECGMEVEEVEF